MKDDTEETGNRKNNDNDLNESPVARDRKVASNFNRAARAFLIRVSCLWMEPTIVPMSSSNKWQFIRSVFVYVLVSLSANSRRNTSPPNRRRRPTQERTYVRFR